MEFSRACSNRHIAALAAAILAAGTMGLRPASADTYTDSVIDRTVGGQAVGYATSDTDGYNHAAVWLSNGTFVNLNPAGFRNSLANNTNGSQQVGSAYTTATSSSHAVIWSGSASITDLNPTTGYEIGTFAYGISTDGSQQVGYGYGSATSYNANALLWTGSAASVVNLQPTNLTGFSNTFAYGTNVTNQVGYGTFSDNSHHALLWSATANSAVDLHPASGFTNSFAEGVSGTQQVGYGYTTAQYNPSHALLWTGTAASVVDLNPAGYNASSAYSTNGTTQVGYGNDASYTARALAWTGTAASAVNLSALLPNPGAWTFSIAYGIDATGDVFGWANGTYNSVQGMYAIEWSPNIVSPTDSFFSPDDVAGPDYTATVLYEAAVPVAPEPASLTLLGLAAFPFLLRRRR